MFIFIIKFVSHINHRSFVNRGRINIHIFLLNKFKKIDFIFYIHETDSTKTKKNNLLIFFNLINLLNLCSLIKFL
jgi:hypothetical protein